MKQHEAVILTLEKLSGIATLGQLNQEVLKIKECEWKTKTPFASIRRIVQTKKEIYKIKPGLYGLIKYQKKNEEKGIFTETKDNKEQIENTEFNHTYYQGLLLIIGKLKNFHTYCPNQDKNKNFIDKKLSTLRSFDKIPLFSYPTLVKRSSTIDVTWYNDRIMPHSFFEVEHSSDIQNSLIKFNDLQDFYVRMFIVSNKKNKHIYEKKINYSVFKDLSNRVIFLDYEVLVKQYENMIELSNSEIIV